MNAEVRGAPRGRVALVMGETMDGSTLQVLGDACARAHARLWVWGSPAEAETWPSVVVAALSAGSRQIPDSIIDVADRRYPGTQLLLLCDEPLVRPTLTLQQGRITLVEPPATVERMTSRLRLLLARDPRERAPAEPSPIATPPAPSLLRCHEYRRPTWW